MKHTVWKVFYDYRKKEKWLNEMAAKGMSLLDYFWIRYVFEDTEPGKYTYRIEFLEHWHTHAKSRQYIQFLEETDMNIVGAYMHWIIIRRPTSDSPFNIYSNLDAKISHANRIYRWFLRFAILEYGISLYEAILMLKYYVASKTIQPLFFAAVFLTGLMGTFLLSQGLKLKKKAAEYQKEKNIYET